ncbi:MAG: 16S rRNA (cytosine(1402)-N(4))-methyltransferase RsmH [Pseudomonadota bacterium]
MPSDALQHEPVLLAEVLEALGPVAGETYIDATLGAGGYSRAILGAGAGAGVRVVALDRDPDVIKAAQNWGRAYGDCLFVVETPFDGMRAAIEDLRIDAVDGVVFDLGVSSMQLDQSQRGFSFRTDGPLSMRMDGGRPNAFDLVNGSDARDLAAIFRLYGEERKANLIARAIVAARASKPIDTTLALADIIANAAPGKREDKIHPATRTFQAIRIFVNDELGQFVRALLAAEAVIKPGGRLVIVSFHSLEDRIAKRFFAERTRSAPTASRHAPVDAAPSPTFEGASKAIAPTAEECTRNARARSAKLRYGTRTAAPAREDMSAFAPRTPIFTPFLSQWSTGS